MFDIVITKDLLNNVKGKWAPKAKDNIMRYIIKPEDLLGSMSKKNVTYNNSLYYNKDLYCY